MRAFSKRLGEVVVMVVGLLTGSGVTTAAAPEIRATWITTTSSDDWSAANLPTTMNSLRTTGLNTVYVEAWKNGYTNFTSPALSAFTGRPSLNPTLAGRNLLSETRTAAANAGLIHGAWFEYGLMAQYGGVSNSLAVTCRDATWTVGTTSGTGWLLKDSAGNFTNASSNFVWMNPLVPEVRNLIKGIVVDAINQFDLQIVQFDDHLAWPVQFGWDDYTRAVYRAETGRNLPTTTSNSAFLAWRQDKTKAFFEEISAAAKAAKPSVVVSLAPSTASFSAANYCADWPTWMGATDEVLPQVYRSTIASFNTDWPLQVTASGTNRDELGVGLRLLGTGSATPWSDLEQQLNRSRADNALGHSIWYSEGVSRSGTSNPSNYNAQLTSYYNVAGTGPAANPHFTAVRWGAADGRGGSGTWSTLASTWTDRSTIWVQDALGIFDGVGGTVTVSGSLGVGGGLEFRSDGYLLTSGTLVFKGINREANAVRVADGVVTTLAGTLSGSSGLMKTGGGTLVLTGSGRALTGGVDVQAGTLRLAGGTTLESTTVIVRPGATLDVADGLVATVSGLDLGAGGLIDVGAGTMVIRSGSSTGDLVAAIRKGLGDGSWNGDSGISSSVAAADVELGNARAVGWLANDDGSVTVAYAAPGDVDLDGAIDLLDVAGFLSLARLDTGEPSVWSEGDFNADGIVDLLDISLSLATNLYDAGGYRPAPQSLTAVPEPTSICSVAAAMAILTATAAVGRRRRPG